MNAEMWGEVLLVTILMLGCLGGYRSLKRCQDQMISSLGKIEEATRLDQFRKLQEELATHQKKFQDWIDYDLEVAKKKATQAREDLTNCEGNCERLGKENKFLSEKLNETALQLEKERMIRSSIEQLIQVRAADSASAIPLHRAA